MSDSDLPFRAEYAKSNRSSCKACKAKIDKDELRLAAMVQSPMFDGKVPNWFHAKCFFGRNRPKAVGDIGHYDALRWEDQERVAKMLEETLAGKSVAKGKGKAAAKGQGMSKLGTLMGDFRVELAKSGGAACKVCEVKIKKGLARIGKKDYDSQRAKMYGPFDRWYHVECFAGKREELEFYDAGEDLQGFMTLGEEEKKEIREKLKPLKKRKTATASNGATEGEPEPKAAKLDEATKEKIKKQVKKIYYYRDLLQHNLVKRELEELLEFNGQEVPSGVDKLLDRLSDIMTFGALEPCETCGGQLVFRSGVGYQCTGNISEWTKCQEKTDEPKRKAFKLPKVREFTNAVFRLTISTKAFQRVRLLEVVQVQGGSSEDIAAQSVDGQIFLAIFNVIQRVRHFNDLTLYLMVLKPGEVWLVQRQAFDEPHLHRRQDSK